jgi:hypothetical protein
MNVNDIAYNTKLCPLCGCHLTEVTARIARIPIVDSNELEIEIKCQFCGRSVSAATVNEAVRHWNGDLRKEVRDVVG